LRLKQLEIFGFKSFAQKVTIPFDPGITAIVGPNGCGKSNVVEAIRWVLGEQRPGSFRSHRMEDVIFGGTRDRKPLNIAEASLVIDNSSGILRVDYGEVMLTRRLYRSGESDYLLNRVPCRLLDITNLLMDTGLGQGAYAVMEQGMVDEVVSEHTENRRRILEEAAGITKFKVRRRATWSKLESTRADLTRIEDIIGEVKRQVDYLSRQVGRARRYQTLKEELDRLEVLLGRARYHGCRAQALPLQQELDALNAALTEGNTRFATKEADLERLRLAETETERRMQQIGGQVAQQVQLIHERDRLLATARAHQEATQRAIDRAARDLRLDREGLAFEHLHVTGRPQLQPGRRRDVGRGVAEPRERHREAVAERRVEERDHGDEAGDPARGAADPSAEPVLRTDRRKERIQEGGDRHRSASGQDHVPHVVESGTLRQLEAQCGKGREGQDEGLSLEDQAARAGAGRCELNTVMRSNLQDSYNSRRGPLRYAWPKRPLIRYEAASFRKIT